MKKKSSREDLPSQRLLRQRELLESMRHENETLKSDLFRESQEVRRTASSVSTASGSDIVRLQDETSKYLRRIELERKKVEELDHQIALTQEKIVDQRSRMGGINAAQTSNQLIKKQLKVFEGRMDKGLIKFNELLAQNKTFRQRIEDYRKERIVFDGIYKKLEKELHEKKKEMAEIIEESKHAYSLRDQSQAEISSLQKHASKEKAEFENEFKVLGELIRQQQQTLEQLRLKQLERTHDHLIVSNTLLTNGEGESINANDAWSNMNKEKGVALSQEKIIYYEESLKRVQERMGVEDIQDIITQFLEAEEQNFSLFNYVNDINSEVERIEHSISEMRGQVERYRGQGMSTDTQRKKVTRVLTERIDRTDRRAEEYESRHQQAVRTITQLKNGISNIYSRINATPASGVDELKGSSQGITESNMLQYLGIIEQKTSEILQAYAAVQIGLANESTLHEPSVVIAEPTPKFTLPAFGDDGHHLVVLGGGSVGGGVGGMGVGGGGMGGAGVGGVGATGGGGGIASGLVDDGEIEEDERPLTRHELERKTLRDFSKKINMSATL